MRRRTFLGCMVAAAANSPLSAMIHGIKTGVCNPIKNFAEAESFGYDYFEPGVAELASLSDDQFNAVRHQVLASRLRCQSCNSFIRTLKVVGPSVDTNALDAYMNQALDRCRQLGTEIVVWGSAGSRNVPPEFSRQQAWDQIKIFLHRAGEVARRRNIVIAIEPLNKSESNIINTGAEALRLVGEVGHPNVKMIIDYYHMRLEKEPPEILVHAADQIVHLHFANPQGRRWPKLTDSDPEYGQFFELLKKINYRGGISIEGRGSIEADAAGSLAFFRHELS